MSAVISPGTFTAHRYAVSCPLCGDHRARPDCDSLGRSVVRCACRPTPILMPTAAPIVHVTPSLRIIEAARNRRTGRFCARGCGRRVGPKAKHCNVCARLVASALYKCPEPGCENTRTLRQRRCSACKKVHDSARVLARWRRTKANRVAAA